MVPVLRGKVERVIRRAAFRPESHDAKALARTLETYPRDELFAISMGIVALGERQRVRLFVRRDPYQRFVSCLVFVPRDRFNTDNRERIASVLSDAFDASEIDWALRLSDSMLARIHYVVRCSAAEADHDVADIERRIADVTRPWTGDLADALTEVHGEERGNSLFHLYRAAFPIAYCADWRARAAVDDIDRAEALAACEGLVMSVYETVESDRPSLRCKLLSSGERSRSRMSCRSSRTWACGSATSVRTRSSQRVGVPFGSTTSASFAASTSTSGPERRAPPSKTPSRGSGAVSSRTTCSARLSYEPV